MGGDSRGTRNAGDFNTLGMFRFKLLNLPPCVTGSSRPGDRNFIAQSKTNSCKTSGNL